MVLGHVGVDPDGLLEGVHGRPELLVHLVGHADAELLVGELAALGQLLGRQDARRALEGHVGVARAHPAHEVVLVALLGILEDVVGVGDLGEGRLGGLALRVALVDVLVRVQLDRKLLVGLADGGVIRVGLDA
ncbi:hypothetical protein D3C87_1745690 [compost metagenome]